MAVNTYETVFITDPEIAPEAVDDLVNKIKQIVTNQKGAMTHEDRWGRRRMSYPIQGHRDGFYVVLDYTSEAPVVLALEHLFRVTDSVIRQMTVRVIKKNKTFPPRRVKPAGSYEAIRGGRPGSRPMPTVTPPPGATPPPAAAAPVVIPDAAPAAAPAAVAETPATPGASA